MEIKFLRHARQRIVERALSPAAVSARCAKAAPMLTVNVPLRFRVGNTTIVAKKKNESVVEIITAWKTQAA